ncbi:MAG: hypothetical protein LUQ11_08340 [Methylococcaceae bacterium]|nr:hypothetical protein [Methylococcaceae bacterium]
MSLISRWLGDTLAFLRRSRDENLRWQLSRQDDVAELRQARALAEQALLAQLKKQTQQLAHELEVNKARNNTELAMVKTQCKQDLKDYQQYLQSLDRLKESLRNSYAHLPEAVAFTIHHHAKQLLNQMWETQEPQEKMKVEMQLLQFMTAVHEDSQASLQSSGNEALPQKALAIIDANLDVK